MFLLWFNCSSMIEETRQKKTKQKLKKKNEIKLCLIKRIQANFYFLL